MKFTIDRADAREALSKCAGLVKRSQIIAILSNLHIAAGDGKIRITATDLNLQVSVDAKANVERGGEITVPADKMVQIVESLPEGSDLLFDFDLAKDPRATVKSGRSVFRMGTLPPADFPMMKPKEDDETVWEFPLSAKTFARIIDRGTFAMARDKIGTYLNCAFMVFVADGEETVLQMVSTDRQSLAFCEAKAPEGIPEGACAKIPAESVKVFSSLLSGLDMDVGMMLTPSKIVMRTDKARLIARQVDGEYVEYTRVFPKTFQAKAKVDTDLVIGLMRRAAIMCGSDDRVRLDFKAGSLGAQAANVKDGGEAQDEIDCDLDGSAVQFALSASKVLTILEMIETENVIISIPENVERGVPILFEPDGDSDWFALRGTQVG